MPLVNAKCTNCGAPLQVDNTHEAAVCQYCGSAFIVEKAIQNFNISFTNNITAQNVIIAGKGEMEKERLLQNAKTQLGFNDTASARSTYQQVTNDYPDDYRGWYGMACILSTNFNNTVVNERTFAEIKDYMRKALKCVPNNKKNELNNIWNDYTIKYKESIKTNKESLDNCFAELETINPRIEQAEQTISKNQKRIIKISYLKIIAAAGIFGILSLALLKDTITDGIALGLVSIIICVAIAAIIIAIFKINNNKRKQLIDDASKESQELSKRKSTLEKKIQELQRLF